MASIGRQAMLIDYYKDELEDLGKPDEGHDDARAKERKRFKDLLEKAEKAIETLDEFHTKVTKHWTSHIQRVLGYIAYSPPISVGTGAQHFTEDWALIELHGEKIDWEAFKGNVIDLGTFWSTPLRSSSLILISRYQDFDRRLILNMYPHSTAPHLLQIPA